MGMIHDDHGRMSVEERSESFYIHPTYGYERTCPVCNGDPPHHLQGECAGGCTRAYADGVVDEPGRVPDLHGGYFDRYWRDAHPEFLLEDVPDLIRALADLPTCPQLVKDALARMDLSEPRPE